MAYVIYTDEAYKRDFYHYTLRAHFEGIGIVVNKGFEWKEEEGAIKYISVKYPINPYWYELGNKPNYLSSRKIYWYRARLTYWLEGPEITIYGEWVQFTSINPMCTGFTNFDAKRMMKKYYSYHGIIKECPVRAEPEPFVCEPEAPPGPSWVLLAEGDFSSTSYYKLNYYGLPFLRSTDPDTCPIPDPYGFRVYYFCEVTIQYNPAGNNGTLWWNNGLECKIEWWDWTPPYCYCAWYNYLWSQTEIIFMTYKPLSGSHYRVWGSSTGELPVYYPVPLACYPPGGLYGTLCPNE